MATDACTAFQTVEFRESYLRLIAWNKGNIVVNGVVIMRNQSNLKFEKFQVKLTRNTWASDIGLRKKSKISRSSLLSACVGDQPPLKKQKTKNESPFEILIFIRIFTSDLLREEWDDFCLVVNMGIRCSLVRLQGFVTPAEIWHKIAAVNLTISYTQFLIFCSIIRLTSNLPGLTILLHHLIIDRS